jgi:hypothetical protein
VAAGQKKPFIAPYSNSFRQNVSSSRPRKTEVDRHIHRLIHEGACIVTHESSVIRLKSGSKKLRSPPTKRLKYAPYCTIRTYCRNIGKLHARKITFFERKYLPFAGIGYRINMDKFLHPKKK